MMVREKATIEVMIKMYCSDLHTAGESLCEECAGLLDYANSRLDKCPFGKKKPPCAKCSVHCYGPSMRPRITRVMRHAGPRMISRHPILALSHVIRGS